MNGSADSKLAGILIDNYGFVIGDGGGGRGHTAPLLQDGAGPVMKPEMGMWLATPAGNNGLSHCGAFFPPSFLLKFISKLCIFLFFKEMKQKKKQSVSSSFSVHTI